MKLCRRGDDRGDLGGALARWLGRAAVKLGTGPRYSGVSEVVGVTGYMNPIPLRGGKHICLKVNTFG